MPVTKLVNAQQAAQRNLTTVTELTAGNPTLETHAQKSYNDETLLREHFVPLPTNIQTPVNADLLAAELEVYTFPDLAEYLISDLREGFHLGYTGPRFAITPKNLKSAWDNAAQVTEAIVKELSRDHIAGPFPTPPLENLHCSPLGAVPKNDNTWCLILDLSSPRGQSVNESISKDDFSVKFTKFDDAVDMVSRLVKGALMAKIYIKHAFRLLPVHPDDWDLLGTCWAGLYFVELRLPFGGRSSVYIFNSFTDTLTWILRVKHTVDKLVHFLDDFLLVVLLILMNVLITSELLLTVSSSWGPPGHG